MAKEAKADIDALVGLKPVKRQFNELVAVALDAERRRTAEPALPTDPMSHHLVFTGNPGTGKTTVASAIGKAYYGLGLLDKPDTYTVNKQDLVGRYLGDTEEKTAKVWDKARGGVLFIDEAYRLADDQYGQSALDQIMEKMETDRDNTVVIIAGYPKETNALLKTNPGLRSRFPRSIKFPDYKPEEMAEIFSRQIDAGGYELDDSAAAAMAELLPETPMGSNARSVRNLTESLRRAQAVRLAQTPSPSRDDLRTITAEDVEAGVADYTENNLEDDRELDFQDNELVHPGRTWQRRGT